MRGIGATILTGFGAYDSDTPLNTPLQIRRGKGVTFCENQKVKRTFDSRCKSLKSLNCVHKRFQLLLGNVGGSMELGVR